MPFSTHLVLRLIVCTLLWQNIAVATTPTEEYAITDFGAIGDSTTLNTTAIQAAIDAAFKSGGGRVIIPSGVFYTGSIQLKDNVHLYLAPGSKLYGNYRLANAGWPGYWGKYKRYPAFGFEFRYIEGLFLDNLHFIYPYDDKRPALQFSQVKQMQSDAIFVNYEKLKLP